jgi:hypothetical protein
MKWITAFLLALLLSPLMARAERPSTQPSRPGKGEGAFARQQNMKRDGFAPGMKPTQAELDEALDFMKDTAPHHLELFNRLPEGGPRRARAEQIMVTRYHNLMRMKEQNPDAYDAMLEQWKLEDEAIGFAQAVREKTQPDADVRLREVVRRMVQKSLDVRRERIEKLKKLLDEQQKQLDQDEQNKDQLMKQQIAEALNKFQRLFGVDGGKDRGPIDQGDGHDGKDVNALTK